MTGIPNDPRPDPARSRWIAIQAMRWTGLVMVLVGLLVVNRRIDLPEVAGYVLVVVGLFDALIVPTMLAKGWKSPPQ